MCRHLGSDSARVILRVALLSRRGWNASDDKGHRYVGTRLPCQGKWGHGMGLRLITWVTSVETVMAGRARYVQSVVVVVVLRLRPI